MFDEIDAAQLAIDAAAVDTPTQSPLLTLVTSSTKSTASGDPKRPVHSFEAVSVTRVSRQLIEDLSVDGCAPVFCEGKFWRVGEGKLWREFPRELIAREHMDYEERGCSILSGKKWLPYLVNTSDPHIKAIEALTHDGEFFTEAKRGLAFADLFVFVDAGKIKTESLTSKHRTRVGYPFAYNPRSRAPKFMAALRTWFDGDVDREQKIWALQEFIGACLFGQATRYEQSILLPGDGDNGKSVLIKVLKEVMPKNTVTAFTPQELTGEDKSNNRALLAGKLLNMNADVPHKELVDVEAFKKAVTGDMVTGKLLYKDGFQYRATAGHMFGCNRLPEARDDSKGYWRRWLIIEFNRAVPVEMRVDAYEEVLLAELQGIVAWAVRGLSRLLRRKVKKYTQPGSSITAVQEYRRDNNPVALFLLDWFDDLDVATVKPQQWTLSNALYSLYSDWCGRNGYKATNSRNFGIAMTKLKTSKPITAGTVYAVKLKDLEARARRAFE